jgi:hypothetical protein
MATIVSVRRLFRQTGATLWRTKNATLRVNCDPERQNEHAGNSAGQRASQSLAQHGAVLLGFFVVALLSLGTDEILHLLKVYPPWAQPMHDPRLNLLALSYRLVYAVIGSYIAARFAPRNPMRHAMVLGVVGFILSVPGVVFIITHRELGPVWYPVALMITALPCAWLGGLLYQK